MPVIVALETMLLPVVVVVFICLHRGTSPVHITGAQRIPVTLQVATLCFAKQFMLTVVAFSGEAVLTHALGLEEHLSPWSPRPSWSLTLPMSLVVLNDCSLQKTDIPSTIT